MDIGTKVWFTAPQNVNQLDHGLDPGQVVPAVVVATGIQGDEWVTVRYGNYAEVSAHVDELTIREAMQAMGVEDMGIDFSHFVRRVRERGFGDIA